MYFVYILRKKEKFVCVCVVLCTKVHFYSHSRGVCVRVEKHVHFFINIFFTSPHTHNKKNTALLFVKNIFLQTAGWLSSINF